ncbi:restriction endonuclease FokI C-terminal domain-containing protein [Huintestinicola sp.]|uniref:restriction endonuclease FokI C-terminal domain-containing protein n=1 Tax=Huintestinicola sp. TaxID=2981661 RepID=UPI003D7D53C6
MAERTFGWVQEAYTIANLKNVVRVFVPDSAINKLLKTDKIPRLITDEYHKDEMIKHLNSPKMNILYTLLKGKGTPKGYTRTNAPCSGIIQAVLPGQRKEYQSDWPADSFLRWAVSIGFLDYDREMDSCSISELGYKYAVSEDDSKEEKEILTEAFLSYPPVCRILSLLESGNSMTKFEIGCQLGFVGEAGFTSIPQNLILQGLSASTTSEERNKLLSDTEGTSDKYVRTICAWLKSIKWVMQVPKSVTADLGYMTHTDTIPQSYQITLEGKKILKYATGSSKFKRIDKRVMWDMLATKPSDRNYLRNRRTYLIKYLSTTYRSLDEIIAHLQTKGMAEDAGTISDDIQGLINIGINVNKSGDKFKIMDSIIGLEIPDSVKSAGAVKSDLSLLKDDIRKKLSHINHKYLVLIDLGFDGQADREYELQTADLLTGELDFKGSRLGDTRKPDVCVYHDKNGFIIDNKAYGKGYSLPIKQADEMFRYIEENQKRDKALNPNEWWTVFDGVVSKFNFAFVSGEFTGGFKDRIENISRRSGVNGAAINSVNLLLLAEEIKSGRLSYANAFDMFECNDEIKIYE